MHRRENIFCIVVTFNPDTIKLQQIILNIAKNNVKIVIIDNGSANIGEIEAIANQYGSISTIKIDSNIGIAAAQNKGIAFALDNNADMLWFSDQDTIYTENYINDMSKCIASISDGELSKYAAFGPAYIDTNRDSMRPFVIFNPFSKNFEPKPGLNEASHLIASGMLVPVWAINKVGLKQEDLFIDWVDLEWCWRATKIHGLKIAGCGDVVITHTLGDQFVSLLGRKISFRSPFRHYFIVRNAIALGLYSQSLFINQRIEVVAKGFIWAILYPALAPSNKLSHLKATFLGLAHGLVNKLGPKK